MVKPELTRKFSSENTLFINTSGASTFHCMLHEKHSSAVHCLMKMPPGIMACAGNKAAWLCFGSAVAQAGGLGTLLHLCGLECGLENSGAK